MVWSVLSVLLNSIKNGNVFSDDLIGGISFYKLGTFIPAENESIFIDHKNAVVAEALD